MNVKLVVLATCFFLFACAPVFGADLKDLVSQRDATNKQLVAQLDEYTKVCEQYQATVEERMKAEEELVGINDRIKTLKADLSVRATSMYRQGPYRMIDLLLGSTTFAEFTTTWEFLRMINEQQASLVEEMRALQTQQGELIEQCAENEQTAKKLIADIDAQTAELKAQIEALDGSIARLRSEAKAAELAKAEETRRNAQAALDNQPTAQYPMPSYLGDGAWDSTISALLTKYGLPQSWLPTIRNIIWRESTNNPNAVGGGGAYVGLCQFGAHWGPPRGWSGTGDWRYDPVASIERMIQYIADTGGLGNHWAGTNY